MQSSNGEDAQTLAGTPITQRRPLVEDVPALSEIEDLMWDSDGGGRAR